MAAATSGCFASSRRHNHGVCSVASGRWRCLVIQSMVGMASSRLAAYIREQDIFRCHGLRAVQRAATGRGLGHECIRGLADQPCHRGRPAERNDALRKTLVRTGAQIRVSNRDCRSLRCSVAVARARGLGAHFPDVRSARPLTRLIVFRHDSSGATCRTGVTSLVHGRLLNGRRRGDARLRAPPGSGRPVRLGAQRPTCATSRLVRGKPVCPASSWITRKPELKPAPASPSRRCLNRPMPSDSR